MITKDPRTLRLHPLRAKLPSVDPANLDQDQIKQQNLEHLAFLEAIKEAGPDNIPPIVISGRYVIDGVRRLEGAQNWQWKEIRCMEVPEDQAGTYIVESTLQQKSMSRDAKIYTIFSLMPQYLEGLNARRKYNIKNVGTTTVGSNPQSCGLDLTRAELCERWGVKEPLLERAVTVARLFAKDAEAKAKYEHLLLLGEMKLWNVLSAIKGEEVYKADRRRPVNSDNQLKLFTDNLQPIVRAVTPWARLTSEAREKMSTQWHQAQMDMPAPAFLDLLTVSLKMAPLKLEPAQCVALEEVLRQALEARMTPA
jgi:hypothetical protein